MANVTIATRGPLRWQPQRVRGRDFHWWLVRTDLDTSRFGPWLARGGVPVIDDGRRRAAIARGKPKTVSHPTLPDRDALTNADVMTFADNGYQGASGTIRTPFKRHRHRRQLSRNQKAVTAATSNPGPRRTRQCHPQDLENPGQAPLLPTPRHHDRAGHPRPAPRRIDPLHRMKKAGCGCGDMTAAGRVGFSWSDPA